MFSMGEGYDRNGLHANGDSFELCGGLHLTPVGTTRSWPGFRCAGNPGSDGTVLKPTISPEVVTDGHILTTACSCADYWLSEAGNSRSVAATALMAAGSSVQGRPALVQAWKLVTLEPLAASVSSTHASCSSASCSGERGSLSTDAICPAAACRLTSARAGLLWKKLRNPICGAPFDQ